MAASLPGTPAAQLKRNFVSQTALPTYLSKMNVP
jgi:hypothetical protein